MELKYILESILFNAQQPLNGKALKDLLAETAQEFEEAREFKKVPVAQIESALAELEKEHALAERSFRLVCVAESWQFVSKTEFSPWIKTLVGQKNRPSRLSQPALETLAIIAYRQPVTRAEVEEVRGVAVDGVMQTLLERGLVEQVGRAEAAGRPVTFGTTSLFLEYFGLKNLEDLPAGDELRRIVVNKPETLETTEPNRGDGTQGAAPAASVDTQLTAVKTNSGAEQEAGGAEVKNPS
ncbi:MAG TPA: SMC-Scp complex subunit ScpB [Candidatus Saccharimonadales bacterium]|nr:SMC-Scp complex subunit ScpB [Candidatus Saccharimonadales bacterium]